MPAKINHLSLSDISEHPNLKFKRSLPIQQSPFQTQPQTAATRKSKESGDPKSQESRSLGGHALLSLGQSLHIESSILGPEEITATGQQ